MLLDEHKALILYLIAVKYYFTQKFTFMEHFNKKRVFGKMNMKY